MVSSSGDITLVVHNLGKRRRVQRERSSEDRRVAIVSLTETGTTLIEQIFPGHVAAIVEEMGALTAEEQQMLGRLCRKLGKRES